MPAIDASQPRAGAFAFWQKIWIGLCIVYPAATLISIAAANLLLALMVLGWISCRPNLKTLPHTKWLCYLVMIYLAWNLVAMAFSPYGIHGRAWLEERSTFLAIIPGLTLGANLDRLRKSFRYVSLMLVFLAVYAVYQYFFGWDLLRGRPLDVLFHRYHATGLQDFHLTFAGMIGLAAPVAAGMYSVKGIKSSLIALAGALAVICSMARTMMLGLIGGGVLFLIFGSRRLRITGAVLLAALMILPNTIFTASGERMKRGLGIAEAPAEQQGDPTRIYLWESALNIIVHYPWLGVGEGNWRAVFDRYGIPYDNYSTTAGAHNDFLNAAVENGMIGGVILVALWGYVLFLTTRSAWRAKGSGRDLRLGFLAAFLIILFGGMFQGYQTDAEVALLLWFLVGVSVRVASQESGTAKETLASAALV